MAPVKNLHKLRKVSKLHNKKHSYYKQFIPIEHLINGDTTHQAITIDGLPNEILFLIFSYIPQMDLHSNVKEVCKHWENIVIDPILWKTIRASEEIPTQVLVEWIKRSTLLKSLSVINRNDTNLIIEVVSRHCKRLESFEMVNCWGSEGRPLIYGRNLCNLVTRCGNIKYFNFIDVKFNSRKFFKLIIQKKRGTNIYKKCNYLGPMNAKQLTTLLEAIRENSSLENAMLCNIIRKHKIDVIPRLLSLSNNDEIRSLCHELLHPYITVE